MAVMRITALVVGLVVASFGPLGCSELATIGLTSDSEAGGANDPFNPMGEDPKGDDPNGDDPKGDDPNGDDPAGDPTNSGCVSERLEAPAGDNCVCEFDSCDGTSLACTCDLECYDEDCLITVDAEGNPISSDGFIGDCVLSCTPEDDLSEEMNCSLSDCEIVPNVVDINPVTTPNNVDVNPVSSPNSVAIGPAASPNSIQINPVAPVVEPPVSSFEAEREINTVQVVFVVDNSGSMVDNQMAAACAVESFTAAASADGGEYETGVLTTDMLGDRQEPGATYDKYSFEYVGPAELVALDGPCSMSVGCNNQCNATIDEGYICDFSLGGTLMPGGTPASLALLKQLLVQGDGGSNYEGGLEQAFQFFAEQERQGLFDPEQPKEVIVLSDEDADARLNDYAWLCPFYRPDRNTDSIPNFNPPTPTNTMASCEADLIDFYVYYFTSRNIIVHGLLYTSACASDSTERRGDIYSAVIRATGGQAESICDCSAFDGFFNDVGQSTSTLSTEMCFSGALPDPSTIVVTHVDTGDTVPQSAVNGWSLDPALQCVVMNGAWQSVYGTFRIEYIDPTDIVPPVDPFVCVDPGDTVVAVTCNGQEVPMSTTDGYTFDQATNCFEFHGRYTDVDGATCVVTLPPDEPLACVGADLDAALDSLQVTCDGRPVPASSADGYTYDVASDCFTFHGSYLDVDGATCVVTLPPDDPLACLDTDVGGELAASQLLCDGREVPPSATDGYTYDPASDCFGFHGSYRDVDGATCQLVMPPDDPLVCLAVGVDPLLQTIHVYCSGEEVPESVSDGFTFDPVTDCFEFHGSYRDVDNQSCLLEYL